MVIWIIGLSGAGKSTIAAEVFRQWRDKAANVVLVDGDDVRNIFEATDPRDYGIEGRRSNARRITAICRWLDRQGIHVVCPVLSIFEEDRRENRTRFSAYFEVYVEATMEDLLLRDTKSLYRDAIAGARRDVVGIDIPFMPPSRPDIVIRNGTPCVDARVAAAEILVACGAA
jgi:adenylylsulfate kinase-like enzyme